MLALVAIVGTGRSWRVDEDLDPVFDVRDSDNCPDCQGHGRIACIACDGNGLNPALTSHHVLEASNHLIAVDCPRCHGVSREPCLTCFGSTRAAR
jgi:DnaJ-class molecular chaperone